MIDLPVVIDPEDALSQPTRARLFALLCELRRPAGTVELAERLGLHPNGVRLHLERLERQGLVERTRVRRPRGRPVDSWTVAPGAQPAGRAPSAYLDLARWLARALRVDHASAGGLERTGAQIGAELGPAVADPAPAVADPAPAVVLEGPGALTSALSALGFQPHVVAHDAGRITVCLGNCPYRSAARENRTAICALHRGITRGLVEALVPQLELAAFTPRDPDQAGCEVVLSTRADAARDAGPQVASSRR